MRKVSVVALAIVFLLSALFPVSYTTEAAGGRQILDQKYLGEKWHAGLGAGIGGLNSIKSADIDLDDEDELIFGNSQGFLHVLDWNASANGFTETYQSRDMGGAVKGIEIGQIDDDPQLEIAVGYNYVSDIGKVQILDGASLSAESNWSAGIALYAYGFTESEPYGLALGDLDGDENVEIAMGGDRGVLWVADAISPETQNSDRELKNYEAEWYVELDDYATGEGNIEVAWGLTFGQFDTDEAIEVAVGTKQGLVLVFDGQTEELQWKIDVDGSSEENSLCYGLMSADLNGNDIDELVVSQQTKLTVFIDGDRDNAVETTAIKTGYGLDSSDLDGDGDNEIAIANSNGNIYILNLDGGNLDVVHEWYSGYAMNAYAGLTISENGPDKPWIIHGSDAGSIVAWQLDEALTSHSLVWKTDSDNNAGQKIYGLEGGSNYGVAMGNIDDDDNLEILVGSGSGKVYAFDGKTYDLDWVSPVLEKTPMGIAIADLNSNGKREIAVVTGNPGEVRTEAEGNEIGAEGYLYIFEKSGSDFIEAYKSENIDSALGITISELDTTSNLEIGIATGYVKVTGSAENEVTSLHGNVRIFGDNGGSCSNDEPYCQEWSKGFDQIVGGIESGDPDEDGKNEIIIGTGGDDRDGEGAVTGKVYVYHYTANDYILDGSVINSQRYEPYGIAIGDPDNDGSTEIVVGTKKYEESQPLLSIYDGDTGHSLKYSRDVSTNSVGGVETVDFDSDGFVELIFCTSGGELKIFEGNTNTMENWNYEAATSALSDKPGHYGGIATGNVDDDDAIELLVGSSSYLWLFSTKGKTDVQDLVIDGSDIIYQADDDLRLKPPYCCDEDEDPDEDQDILINVTISNYGGAETSKWRVKLYDGDPDSGGTKFTEFSCDATQTDQRSGCKTLAEDESASFDVYWYGILTSPGYHEIYALVEDANSGSVETRLSNNKAFTTINIKEIPNDKPVAIAWLDKTMVWPKEALRIEARDSYDNETTNGEADGNDSKTDLEYNYFHEGVWSGWLGELNNGYRFDITEGFKEPGVKKIKVVVRDERKKESDEIILSVEVRANTQPVAILTSNVSEINNDKFVTFSVSQSNDPDQRATLEYRFDFDRKVLSDWVREGETVRLYQDAVFSGANGGELVENSGKIVTNEFGITRLFKLKEGKLLEVDSVIGVTNRGVNFTIPEDSEDPDKFTYNVKIMAREWDEDGGGDVLASPWSEYVPITVVRPDNIPPVAIAKAGYEVDGKYFFYPDRIEDNVYLGDVVTYTAGESYDSDGDDNLLTYNWVLRDPANKKIDLLGLENEKSFDKVFNEPGLYVAFVTVTDGRGGTHESRIDVYVKVKEEVVESPLEDSEDGFSTPMLIGGSAAGILGLVGGSMALRRMMGESDMDDMFDDVMPDPLELQCPSCGGMISITTAERPVQIGCPTCSSQFVVSE